MNDLVYTMIAPNNVANCCEVCLTKIVLMLIANPIYKFEPHITPEAAFAVYNEWCDNLDLSGDRPTPCRNGSCFDPIIEIG